MKDKSGSIWRWFARVGGLASALALAACGGGGGGGGTPTGTLQMSMTDAPACYDHVIVNVAKVRVHMSGDTNIGDGDAEWREIIPPNAPVQIDLVNLTNGQLADLGTATVPAGTFHQLRLVLADSGNTVTPIGGTAQPLQTPSGQQSGLKIKADFSVLANQTNNVLMDFDACKSIVLTGSGTYILKPVVRLSAMPTGNIQGFVSSAVTQGTATATLSSINVSAQQNGTVVRSTIPDSTGKFTLAFLPSGTYTVVITGDGVSTGGVPDFSKGAATRVVDSVPVATSTVNLNTSTIVLSSSAMNTVTGTVTASTGNGRNAGTTTVSNALVSALQTVSSRLIEVNSVLVDDTTARYTMRLPAAAPQFQAYATPVLPPITTDATAAGKYTLRASGDGVAPKTAPADVSSGPAVVNFSF